MQTSTHPALTLHPNPGPELVPVPLSAPVWPWLLGGALLLAAGGAFYLRRRPRVPLSPLQAFHQAVEAAGPGLAREPTATLTVLAAATRRFLETQFGLPAAVRTTDELLPRLEREERIPAETRSQLVGLLHDADRANFGGFRFPPEQVQAHHAALLRWTKTMAAAPQTAKHEDAPQRPGFGPSR